MQGGKAEGKEEKGSGFSVSKFHSRRTATCEISQILLKIHNSLFLRR
jgi:hypothetical protein